MCEFCDGEGKVCSKCDKPVRFCPCPLVKGKNDYFWSGFDPVKCTHCNGEGK